MKILKFYADWCGPCKQLTKTIDKFKESHPEVEIVSINVEEDETNVSNYKVSSVPTLVKVIDDKEVARKVGAMPLNELEEFILNSN